MRLTLIALLAGLALATGAAARGGQVYSIAPVPASPLYGSTINWSVVGVSKGYITLRCNQAGVQLIWDREWWEPPYFTASMSATIPEPFLTEYGDDGSALDCTATLEEATSVHHSGYGCDGYTYPPPYRCANVRYRATVAFLIVRQ